MGGKRKSAKRVVSKKKITVPKTFKCPYCAHDNSCEVKMFVSSLLLYRQHFFPLLVVLSLHGLAYQVSLMRAPRPPINLNSTCRDRATETGKISCRTCGEDFQCRISCASRERQVWDGEGGREPVRRRQRGMLPPESC
jgi:transcription elongation factor Elf1